MEHGVNPKDAYGIQKVPLHVVPPSSIIAEALALRDGARKYGAYNWRSSRVQAIVYFDACMRHLLSWFDGEELASDSKVPHLAHAKACIAILIDAAETGTLDDNRPPKGTAPGLLEKWKE
jgi:hypothetical protein